MQKYSEKSTYTQTFNIFLTIYIAISLQTIFSVQILLEHIKK